MTIKVSKDRLVAALKAKRAEVVKAHAEAQHKYVGDFADYQCAVLRVVDAFRAKVEKARTTNHITDSLTYGGLLPLPDAPRKHEPKADTRKIDSALARLQVAAEDVITLNENRDGDFLELIG